MDIKISDVYQFIVLIAIVGLLVYTYTVTKELNDTLIGALIGVCVGLPVNKIESNKVNKTEN